LDINQEKELESLLKSLKEQMLLTGTLLATSMDQKIKDHAVHAGLSQL